MQVGGCPGGISVLPCDGGDTAINGSGDTHRSYVFVSIEGTFYGLIGTSVERVEQGTTLVDQAGATMTEIVESIQRVSDGSSNTIFFATKYGLCGYGGSLWAYGNWNWAYMASSPGNGGTALRIWPNSSKNFSGMTHFVSLRPSDFGP